MAYPRATRQQLLERIARLEAEPKTCPCSCHTTHEARKPSPLTMIGRGQ